MMKSFSRFSWTLNWSSSFVSFWEQWRKLFFRRRHINIISEAYPNSVKHLRWSFLQKYLTAFILWKKTKSQVFDRVSNTLLRSSHSRCSTKKGVLKKFAKFTRKHPCQSLFFNKVASWDLQLYRKRNCSTGVFPWILRKF